MRRHEVRRALREETESKTHKGASRSDCSEFARWLVYIQIYRFDDRLAGFKLQQRRLMHARGTLDQSRQRNARISYSAVISRASSARRWCRHAAPLCCGGCWMRREVCLMPIPWKAGSNYYTAVKRHRTGRFDSEVNNVKDSEWYDVWRMTISLNAKCPVVMSLSIICRSEAAHDLYPLHTSTRLYGSYADCFGCLGLL